MSLSDTDQFQPMVLTSLQKFGEEQSQKTDTSEPDFDRFKLLFEKPSFEKEDFIRLDIPHDAERENGKSGFNSIIKKKVMPSKKKEVNKTLKNLEKSRPNERAVPYEKKEVNQQLHDPENTPAQEKALPSEEKTVGKELQDVEKPPQFEKKPPLRPGEISEEKGYQEGVERGLETGMARGQKQGYDEGFKKGEAAGFERGDRQGVEKGHQQGLEKGLEQGFEKGVDEGIAKETEKSRERVDTIFEPLEASLKTVDQTLDLLVGKYEKRIISLIQQITRKVVMAQVDIDNEIVRPMILEALKTLVQPEEVVLSVSLEDYEYIEMIKDDFFEQIDSLNSVTIKSDPSVKKGGCKIETSTACVSADVDSRLDAIFEAIKAAGTAG